MILIHPDIWLEHWQERKNQSKKPRENNSEQAGKDDNPSMTSKILVECDDLFICVGTQLGNCAA